jgi:hypothetical protein
MNAVLAIANIKAVTVVVVIFDLVVFRDGVKRENICNPFRMVPHEFWEVAEFSHLISGCDSCSTADSQCFVDSNDILEELLIADHVHCGACVQQQPILRYGPLDCWNAISTLQVSKWATGSDNKTEKLTLGGGYGATELLLLSLCCPNESPPPRPRSPLLCSRPPPRPHPWLLPRTPFWLRS